MNTDVLGSILVAQKVVFDRDERFHSIQHVLNVVDVPCLPYVVSVDSLVRVWQITPDRTIQLQVGVSRENYQLAITAPRYVKNARAEGTMSGVETRWPLNFMVSEEGSYVIESYVDGERVALQPLTIRMAGAGT